MIDGKTMKDHLRFSVTYEAPDEAAEDALMVETERRLKGLGLQF